MTTDAAMRLMRQAQRALTARRRCARWLPGEPTLCARYAGHPGPHGAQARKDAT